MVVGGGSELAEDQGYNLTSQLCQAAAGLNSLGAQMALGQLRQCPWRCSAVSSLARGLQVLVITMVWMFVTPRSFVETPVPNVMVLGDGTFGRG